MKVISPVSVRSILKSCRISLDCLTSATRVDYLQRYLNGLDVATAVIEQEYVDKDYLEDYASYYSRCFVDYPRKCIRVHFFNMSYAEKDIQSVVTSTDEEKRSAFAETYLGFVVFRPLYGAIIGRTCLIPYAELNTGRHYLALKDVEVSFWGLRLKIKCMPFQEQDSMVAACATCAIWSVTQVTASLFHHAAYPPSYITTVATEHGLSNARCYPNTNGLRVEDMVYALRNIGLDPLCLNVAGETSETFKVLLGNIYAYLSAGIPLIVVGRLTSKNKSGRHRMHAVAINGFHLDDTSIEVTREQRLTATRIDKLYAHDDQLGPYARIVWSGDGEPGWITQWPDQEMEGEYLRIEPVWLIVPLYRKIRASYEDVWKSAYFYEFLLKRICKKEIAFDLEWDIRLLTCNSFKEEIVRSGELTGEQLMSVLECDLPRYLWCMTIMRSQEKLAVFCVDTTDAGVGLNVALALFFSDEFESEARCAINGSHVRSQILLDPLCKATAQ